MEQIAADLGISVRTVYRHRLRPRTPLPTWEVSELALKVWLALDESGTEKNLMSDLGVSRSTLHRGLSELRAAGLALTFRSPTTGKRIHRRREKTLVKDPFDVFSSPAEVKEFDPFAKSPVSVARETVATTADTFADWVKKQYPGHPYQVNRRALMSALGKARREHGITHYQETAALNLWLAGNPRPLGHTPLWRQFLSAYPSLVTGVPSSPAPDPSLPAPRRDIQQAQDLFEQTLEMARDLDRRLKDTNYPVYLDRFERGALYYQRVAKGAPLADPWDPASVPALDDLGGGGVVVDAGLDGQSQERGTDPGQDQTYGLFEPEDVEWYEDEDRDRHSEV